MTTTQKLNEIPVEEISKLVSKKLGHEVKLYGAIAERRDGELYLKIASDNLAKSAGVMTNCYKTLFIQSFNGGISEDGTFYFMPIHFYFEYANGGSNGVEICTVWYDFVQHALSIK